MNKKRFVYLSGLVLGLMFFLFGCAKNTSVEDNINNQNDVDSTDSIDESLVGFSFIEINGVGYSVSKIYNPGETIIIPSEYNNKPVVAIESYAIQPKTNTIKNIVIPNSIESIEFKAFYWDDYFGDRIINIYYDGIWEKWFKLSTYYPWNVLVNGDGCVDYNLYLSNENGDIEYNGKKYSELKEITITSQADLYNLYAVASITTLTITDNILNDNYVSLGIIQQLNEIYYEGTIESWFNLDLQFNMKANTLYVLDSSGTINHNGKKYSKVTEIILPNNFDRWLDYFISKNMNIESLVFSNANLISNRHNLNLISEYNIVLYFDGDYNDIDSSYASSIASNLYVLDESGTVTHNGKTYKLYADI